MKRISRDWTARDFTETAWKFNRECLAPRLQVIYDALLEALLNRNLIALPKVPNEISDTEIADVLLAVKFDNPILFDFNVPRYYADEQFGVTAIVIDYSMKDSDYAYNVGAISRRMYEIYCRLELVSVHTEYGIAKAVHDYLINSMVWCDRTKSDRHHSVIGALIDNEGVCDSIAYAYSLLCNAYGVKASYIYGKDKPEDEITHAWNIVEIDGMRGHVDVGFDVYWSNPYPMYRYFMISDSECARMRRTWPTNGFTKCTDGCSYFVREGLSAVDLFTLKRMIMREYSGAEGRRFFRMCYDYDSTDVKNTAMEAMVELYGEHVNDMNIDFEYDDRILMLKVE